MRRSRFSEEQIIGVLKEADAGVPVLELCRKHGISEHTYYRWKKKYGGMEVGDVRRLQQVEEENRKLKHLAPAPKKGKDSKKGWPCSDNTKSTRRPATTP